MYEHTHPQVKMSASTTATTFCCICGHAASQKLLYKYVQIAKGVNLRSAHPHSGSQRSMRPMGAFQTSSSSGSATPDVPWWKHDGIGEVEPVAMAEVESTPSQTLYWSFFCGPFQLITRTESKVTFFIGLALSAQMTPG